MALVRAALDTGLFVVELLRPHLGGEENLCPVVLQAARDRIFRLVALDAVVHELRSVAFRENQLAELDDALVELLIDCEAEWAGPASAAERAAHHHRFLSLLRHEADVRVAVDVRKHAPHYFVHDNQGHWGPHMNAALGDVQVVTPRQFLRIIGLPVPAKIPRPRRRTRD